MPLPPTQPFSSNARNAEHLSVFFGSFQWIPHESHFTGGENQGQSVGFPQILPSLDRRLQTCLQGSYAIARLIQAMLKFSLAPSTPLP